MPIVGKLVESCFPSSRDRGSTAIAWSVFIVVLAFLIYWTIVRPAF